MAISPVSYTRNQHLVGGIVDDPSASSDEVAFGKSPAGPSLFVRGGRAFSAVQVMGGTPPLRMASPFPVILDGLRSPCSRSDSCLSERSLMSPIFVDGTRSVSPHSVMISPDLGLHPENYLWIMDDYTTEYRDGRPTGNLKGGHVIITATIKKRDPELLKMVLEKPGAVGYLFDTLVTAGVASSFVVGKRASAHANEIFQLLLDLLSSTNASPDKLAEMIGLAVYNECKWLIPLILSHPNACRITPQSLLEVLDIAAKIGDQATAKSLINHFHQYFSAPDYLGVVMVNAARFCDGQMVADLWREHPHQSFSTGYLQEVLVAVADGGMWRMVEKLLVHPTSQAFSAQHLGKVLVSAMRAGQTPLVERILNHANANDIDPELLGQALVAAVPLKNVQIYAGLLLNRNWDRIPKRYLIDTAFQAIRTEQEQLMKRVAIHPNVGKGAPEIIGIALAYHFWDSERHAIHNVFRHCKYEMIPTEIMFQVARVAIEREKTKAHDLEVLMRHPQLRTLSSVRWSELLSLAVQLTKSDKSDKSAKSAKSGEQEKPEKVAIILRASNLAVTAPALLMGGINYIIRIDDIDTLMVLFGYLYQNDAPVKLINKFVEKILGSGNSALIIDFFSAWGADCLCAAYSERLIQMATNADWPKLLECVILAQNARFANNPEALYTILQATIAVGSARCANYLLNQHSASLLSPQQVALALNAAVANRLAGVAVILIHHPAAGQCDESAIATALSQAIANSLKVVVEEMSCLEAARRVATRLLQDKTLLLRSRYLEAWLRLCLGQI